MNASDPVESELVDLLDDLRDDYKTFDELWGDR